MAGYFLNTSSLFFKAKHIDKKFEIIKVCYYKVQQVWIFNLDNR